MYISIDFETRSSCDLRRAGAYAYAEHRDTDVWCMAYAVGDGPIETWLPGDDIPDIDWSLPKRAWNSQFERVIWENIMVPKYGFPEFSVDEWWCTAAQARLMSLPSSLEQAALALNMGLEKDMDGQRLMMRMARPRKTVNGKHTWWDEPERVQRLVEYCVQDVEVERTIASMLRPWSDTERKVFLLDQVANDRGLGIDVWLVDAALEVVEHATNKANVELFELTGGFCTSLTNPARIVTWLRQHGVQIQSLDKANVQAYIRDPRTDALARRILQLRMETGKTSTAKLQAMRDALSKNERIRGALLYAGAARTGRFAGRLVQPQNLPRPELPNPEKAIPAVMSRDADLVDVCFGPPLQVISDLLRSCIVAADGKDFIAADFAAIEARVLAWIADQADLVAAFHQGQDVYKLMAQKIYKCTYDEVTKDQRQMGKMAILGCGYGMGAPKFAQTCTNIGIELSEADAKVIIDVYRTENNQIKKFWYDLENASKNALMHPGQVFQVGRIRFQKDGAWLLVTLPSGRDLTYHRPSIEEIETPWGMRDTFMFFGLNSVTRKYEKQQMYGGRWAENIVQAVARDLLVEAMLRLEDHGYPVVATIHDEILTEQPVDFGQLKEVEQLMAVTPEWAAGCPVAAEGWRGNRYRK